MTEWMRCFVGYLLIAGVATQMLPGKKYEQYVRLFLGFLLIILVLRPILKIGSVDSYLEQKVSEFVMEQEALEEEIFTKSKQFQQENEKMQEQGEIEIKDIETVRVEVMLDDKKY